MGMYRDTTGRLIEVDDAFAQARGYTPAEAADLGGVIREAGEAKRAEDRGIVGDINAVGTGALSGLTLGGTDWLLGQTLTPMEREQLLADIEAHPYLRAGGEMAGALAGGLAAPGSTLGRTPAGYLGSAAAREMEAGLAQGGLRGTAKALNAMGAEGAAQSVGQYIGHTALEDKEVTAEGLAGSAGMGYAFGAAGGSAALGVVKGTIAARRLYSRVMDGKKAAQAAESAWSLAREEALTASHADLRAAEDKLETIRSAKVEAQRGRNEAKAAVGEERIRASGMPERAGPSGETDVSQTSSARPGDIGPEPLIDVGPQGGAGGQTSAYRAPERITFDPSDAAAFDEGMPSMRDQVNEIAGKIEKPVAGGKTGAFKRPEGSTARMSREAPTELENQLAGTKARVDAGESISSIKPSKGNDSSSIEGWLQEKRAFDADELDAARASEDIKGANALRERRQTALSDIRYQATEDLLGPQMAKMEREIQEAADEFRAAVKDLDTLSDGVPEPLDGGEIGAGPAYRPRRPNATTPGRRQARQILDDAHEEALLRAKFAAEPEVASGALSEAEQLENLLEQIDDVSDGVPRMVDGSSEEMFFDQMANDIRKIHRVEEASAKLADVVGEGAHPTSIARAKALRDAEKDSMRKVMDRSAREVEDVEAFGPEYKTPKERVAYARERLNDAQKNYSELDVQEKEARQSFERAGKRVREGEKAKRAALRADKTAAAAAGKLGAADVGGLMEMIDLPGLPKPSDLPVVGPLLGAYLKFRTLKKAMGRMMGKVPATADAQVAARAAQTRDRIGRAVDRSLGLIERGGKYASRKLPAATGILASRIYDDGGEDPGPGASIQKQAAARMREIAAYVMAPNAIELDVRRELRGVTDPDLITAAEKHRRFMFEYILKHMPKLPDQGLIKTHDWEPSVGQAMSLARRMEAMNDPAAPFEKMAQNDLVSLEASEVVRDVYPRLFQEALRRATERAAEAPGKIPYRTRVQMTVFYKMPFEAALSPENLQITQSVYERKPSSPAYNPQAPGAAPPAAPTAQPAIANPVNIAQEMTPALDRR